jgi:hypothetical protein
MTDDTKLMPDDIKFMPAVDRDLYGREFLCPTGREVNQTQKYMCKHIIGLAIRLKAAKPPPVAIFLDYFWILFRYNISL